MYVWEGAGYAWILDHTQGPCERSDVQVKGTSVGDRGACTQITVQFWASGMGSVPWTQQFTAALDGPTGGPATVVVWWCVGVVVWWYSQGKQQLSFVLSMTCSCAPVVQGDCVAYARTVAARVGCPRGERVGQRRCRGVAGAA